MSFIEFKEVDLTFQTKVQRIPIFKGLNLEIEKENSSPLLDHPAKENQHF